MTMAGAFLDGVRRVRRAPAMVLGAYLVTLLLALPMGLALRGALQAHLGASLAADSAASGVNHEWWEEFDAQAEGIGASFEPSIIGFAAVLRNLSDFIDNRSLAVPIVGLVGASVAVWIFLLGGMLDRLARNRPTRAHGFFQASGVFFFRFLRLAVVAAFIYYVLFGYVHHWLFDRFYVWATRDFTAERAALAVRVGLYAIFGALLAAANLTLDYAKVRAVVEDRRSMIGALVAGARFAWRRVSRTTGLYVLNTTGFAVLVALYALVAPGAGGTGASMWLAFLVGQLFVLGRVAMKLTFYASQTALFQSELAHADYTAAPQPVWPESPAAEAVANAAI